MERNNPYIPTLKWQRLQLSEKDFKGAIIKMFQCTNANTLKTNEIIDYLGKEIESLSK